MESDVCQAIQTLNQRAEEKGRAEGKAEANAQTVKKLMQNLGMGLEEAMDAMGLSDSDRRAVFSKMKDSIFDENGRLFNQNSVKSAFAKAEAAFVGEAKNAGFQTENELQDYMKEIRQEVRGY